MIKYLILGSLIITVILIGVILIYVESHRLSTGKVYKDKAAFDRLDIVKVQSTGSRKNLANAWAETKAGNIHLYLKGNPYEMGFQHGRLLKEQINCGVVPIFADPLATIPRYRKKTKWLRSLIHLYLEITLYAPFESNTPTTYLQEIKGMADGAGMDYRTMFMANFLSDFNMAMLPEELASEVQKIDLNTECTSFVVSGNNTVNGELLFGRNTDYSGQGRWAKNQVIVYYEPENANRYVKVSTAGMIKCNSAMNEHGLVIGGHFMGYSGSTPAGISFTIFENEIMRKTKTIAEAVNLLETRPRGGAFGLVIADGKSGKAVAVEANRQNLGIRQMKDDRIAMTNCAFSEELTEVDLLQEYNIGMRNIRSRYDRVIALIEEHTSDITPEHIARFLGDHWDIVVGKERSIGSTVCFEANVTSVVFAPGKGNFWVATGLEPACTNPYFGFNLKEGFEGKPSTVEPGILDGYIWQDTRTKAGLRPFMQAYAAIEENAAEDENTLVLLEAATAADPFEPYYYKILARIKMKTGQYDKAEKLLKRSLDLPQTPNEKAIVYLTLGRVHDITGRRETALTYYQNVVELWEKNSNHPLTGINMLVYGAAAIGLKKPFLKELLNNESIMKALFE